MVEEKVAVGCQRQFLPFLKIFSNGVYFSTLKSLVKINKIPKTIDVKAFQNDKI